MDILIIPLIGPIAIEIILAVVFYYRLFTRGAGRENKLLLAIIVIVLLFTSLSLLTIIQYQLTPLGPPPDYWSEWYSDSLMARRMTSQIATFESLLLCLLSVSFVIANVFKNDAKS